MPTPSNVLAPPGAVRDKLFTPPETFVNIPLGISFALSKHWQCYVEYDAGSNLKSAGLAMLRVF